MFKIPFADRTQAKKKILIIKLALYAQREIKRHHHCGTILSIEALKRTRARKATNPCEFCKRVKKKKVGLEKSSTVSTDIRIICSLREHRHVLENDESLTTT